MKSQIEKPVLVTGATGYVGGRLVPLLLESGFRVRAMGRTLAKLKGRSWSAHPLVELVEGDVFDPESLESAARNCHAAYYLVHSMHPGAKNFESADRKAAENMARAAATVGLSRIIYLGGLGDPEKADLSPHLRSRHEVARILASGPVPVTVLRAAMILGSGSSSFEIMRYLVERLPVMITPRWVSVKNQPIAIRNVLTYLKGCLEKEETIGQTYDIGGPDILTYRRLFDIYAAEAKLRKRLIIPVPFFTPGLSSYWIHIVTPAPATLARPLAEGLKNEVICRDDRIRAIIPQDLLDCRETIRLALMRTGERDLETCWSDACHRNPPEWITCGDAPYAGGTVLECGFRTRMKAKPEDVWNVIARIGGRNGWYYGNALWRLWGMINKLLGGAGMDRGRRSPDSLRVGDALDFWRVFDLDPPRLLRLLGEMKIPGEAIFEFGLQREDRDISILEIVSHFRPKGLLGLFYWYSMVPVHERLFSGMARAIAEASGSEILKGPDRITSRLAGKRECKP